MAGAELLPMRGPTPIECAYDVLAVRWWWWTDHLPRVSNTPSITNWPAAEALYREALARRIHSVADVRQADRVPLTLELARVPLTLELAMELACGERR